jgi:hypothetical protein
MRPRRPGPKDVGRVKFIEPEPLADGGFVLGIEPFRPLAGIVLRRSKVEVLDIRAHLAAEAAGLVMERAPDDENLPPERPVGFDPQEAFTERNKTCNVQDGVGIQIMKLNPIGKEEPAKERMRGKRKPLEEKGKEKYPEARG